MLGWRVIPRIGVGPLQISPHGVGIAIGVYVGSALLARRARNRGYDADLAWNAAAVGVIGAIVGARTAYVIGHLGDYSSGLEVLRIWHGGLSLMGSLIGAFLAAWLYLRHRGVDFFTLADPGAAPLALGIAIGRTGDLAIGDHLGKLTSKPWGWTYKGGELISASCRTPSGGRLYPTPDGCIAPGMTVHQTALYDMVWSLVIFSILLLLERRPRRRGFLFLTWVAFYCLGRVVTDFMRVDYVRFGTGLTGSQLTALAALAVCAYFLIRYRGVPDRGEPDRPAQGAAGAGGGENLPSEQTGTTAGAGHEELEDRQVTEAGEALDRGPPGHPPD
jgi:phosphatidylglycerol---prolipoprotein diacylglyceryl transferase